MTRPSDSQQKKITCKLVDFAFPADHRVKLRAGNNRDKYQDFAKQLKN